MPTKKLSTDSVRPIRALMRGLDTLQQLNRHNGATVTNIAKAVGLPRTTAYRVLETLCVAGYAVRDRSDERYIHRPSRVGGGVRANPEAALCHADVTVL